MIVKEIEPVRHSKLAAPQILIPAALLLLFIIWRLLIFTATHPAFFRDDYEEVYRGTVARELTLGTSIPLWRYRVDDYAGGFYVVVTLLPFFHYLFGFSMLGLKAFGIVQTGLTMAVWYAVLARYVNQRTAVFFSLLYIFAPFRYITLSSLVFGDHAETCLLSALTVLLFFRMRETALGKRTLSYIALGLLGGFSLWFAYIYGLTLLAILIFLLVNQDRKRLSGKALLFGAASFLAGFSFWIIFNISHKFTGFEIQGSPVWEIFKLENLWKPFLSYREIFFVKLLTNPRAPDIWFHFYDRILMSYAFLFGIWVLYFGWRYIKSDIKKDAGLRYGPIGLCFVYVAVFLITQQMFDAVGLRFLVPFFPFALALIAYGFSEISRQKPLIVFLGAGSLIGLAVVGTGLRFDHRHIGEYLSRKGYSITTLGHVREGIRERIENALLRDFSSLKRTDKAGYVKAFVGQLELQEPNVAGEIISASHYVSVGYQSFYAYLCGREILLRYMDIIKSIELIEPLKKNNSGLYEHALRGIFGALMHIEFFEVDVDLLKKKLSPDLAVKLSTYEGFKYAERQLQRNKTFDEFSKELLVEVRDLDAERKERFLNGVGRVIFRVWSKDPNQAPIQPENLETFPPNIRRALLRGVAAQMLRKHSVYYSSPLKWSWDEFFVSLNSESQKELIEGMEFAKRRWGFPDEELFSLNLSGYGSY